MKPFRSIIITFASMLMTIGVYCQSDNNKTKSDSTKKVIDDYYIDFSVPDLGAFTLLNAKPASISNPGNSKEFAASILNVVSGGSKITPGLAIDWSPYRTFRDSSFIKTPASYKKDFYIRNFQLTFGTVGDSSGTNVALGIKWTFWDKSDPLLDPIISKKLLEIDKPAFISSGQYLNHIVNDTLSSFLESVLIKRKINTACLGAILGSVYNEIISDPDSIIYRQEISMISSRMTEVITTSLSDTALTHRDTIIPLDKGEKDAIYAICSQLKKVCQTQDELNLSISKQVGKLKKEWLINHWNSSVVTFGFGWVGLSADNEWATLKTQSFKTYINGKCGIGKHWEFTYIGLYGIPENTTKTDSSFTSQIFGGVRMLYGNSKNRASLDLGYGYDIAQNPNYNKQTLTATLGFEFKISEGVFFEIAGGLSGDPNQFKKTNILALGSMKYAFHRKSRFDLPE